MSRHVFRFAAALTLVGVASFLTACEESNPPAEQAAPTSSASQPRPPAYDVPFRTDAELEVEIGALCVDSVNRERPLLLEFSAAWCSDCRKLNDMKSDRALAQELREWPSLTVNVGRFDRHTELMASLGVESIAHWAILEPGDCATPVETWARRAARTLEVSSGEARNLTPRDLAEWLSGFRKT